MWGIYGAVTFRTSENKHIKKVGDIFSDDNRINMFRLDGKFSGGDLDYESDGTGKHDDERKAIAKAGYEASLKKHTWNKRLGDIAVKLEKLENNHTQYTIIDKINEFLFYKY